MSQHPRPYIVRNLAKVDDNLFVLFATSRVRKLAQINKNMVILRHNKKQLTLINAIALDESGEALLLTLGTPIRLIRLDPSRGASHDRYYLQKFQNLRRWSPADSEDETLPTHRKLTEDDDAILPACHVFCFRETTKPECALIIMQDYVGNLLVTSEALQAQLENPWINMPVRAQLKAKGFMTSDVVVPPTWLRSIAPSAKLRKAVRSDFDRLLRLDFERVIGASGTMVHEYGKEKVVVAVERGFPQW